MSKGQQSILRVTALSAALLGAYAGPVYAAPDDVTLICKTDVCTPAGPIPGNIDYKKEGTGQAWVVKGENSTFTIDGGSVKAIGKNIRGIGSTSGSMITVLKVDINTNSESSGSAHGVQAFAENSRLTINDSTITTGGGATSSYNVGLQSQEGGLITGTNNTIVTNSLSSPGIEAGTGGKIVLGKGSITTTGNNSAGVRAYSGVYQGNPGGLGVVELDGVAVTTTGNGSNSIGLMAGDTDSANPVSAGNITFLDGSVTTHGNEAVAARVIGGSVLTVENSTVTSHQSHGVTVSGVGSIANLKDTHVVSGGGGTANNAPVIAVHATKGGFADMTDGSVKTTEQFTRGLYTDEGGRIDTAGTTISTEGTGSHAVHASGKKVLVLDGPEVASEIHVTGGTVTTGGKEAFGLYAQNGGKVTANDVAITTSSEGGFGAFLWKGELEINGGSITTTGESFENTVDGAGGKEIVATGAYGVLAKKNSHAKVTGTKITTSGENAEGLRAESDGAEGDLPGTSSVTAANVIVNTVGKQAHGVTAYGDTTTASFSGGSINTTGEEAVGALAHTGGAVTVDGANITTSGKGAVGLAGIWDEDGTAGGMINATNVTVMTSGENAHGAIASEGGSKITLSDSSIHTDHASAAGIQLIGAASVELTKDVKITSGGAVFNSIIEGSNAQSYTVGSGSDLRGGNGVLLDVTRGTAATDDGKVTLNLKADSKAFGNVLDLAGDKGWTSVTSNGQWAGVVIDKTTVYVKDGESSEIGGGDINTDVASGEGSTLTVTGEANIAGSVSGGINSQTSFNGNTQIAGNVFAQQHATLSFLQNAVVVGNVEGDEGSSFNFQGNSDLGGLEGNATSFAFSQGGNHTIHGPVSLFDSSIRGGTLATPIIMKGNAEVFGSILGGNLTIEGRVSGTGSTFNPGNSVGAQTWGSAGAVSGDFMVEVNSAGKSDLITVATGDIDIQNLNLIVGQEDGTGGYVLNHDYTILQTTEGSVKNEFANNGALDDSFAGTLVKLDPVKYADKDVKISLSVDQANVDRTGLSANQNATLDGALSVAGQNASANAVMLMQPDARKAALNQLSGELHGSTQAALLNNSGLIVRTVSNRLRGNLGAGYAAGAPTAQSSGAVSGSMPQSNAYPLWAEVVGSWNSLDGDGNAAKVKSDVGGLFIGGDAGVGSGWRVGGALGYTEGRIKVSDRDSKSDVKSLTAALYGGNSWATKSGSVNFLLGAAYTRHKIDTRRDVNVGGSQQLKADYKADSTQLFTELGYALPMSANSVVEPYAAVAWLGQKAKGFTESGGPAALQGDSQKDTVTTFTLGLRGKTQMELDSGKASLFAGLGWRHASGDVDPGRSVSFIQGNGAAFKAAGAPIAKNAAVLDLGAEMAVGRNTALGLSYGGQFGNGNTDSTGSLYLRMRY